MTSTDLCDAYYSVPIRPEHRNILNLFGQEYCIKFGPHKHGSPVL